MTTFLLIWLTAVPAEFEPPVMAAVHKLEAYQSFQVDVGHSVDSVSVEFRTPEEEPWLRSYTLGLAFCKCWGHESNRVVLNALKPWTPEAVREVVAHELFHIWGESWGHSSGLMNQYYFPSVQPRLLTYPDQWRFVELYNRVKPIPPASAGAWKP